MRFLRTSLAAVVCLLALAGPAHAATLTIITNGTNPGGAGVTPTGQVCNVFGGGTCMFTVANGTTISLAANSPSTPGVFHSGTGDAANCATSTCTFTINTDSSITATFNAGTYPSISIGLGGAGVGDVGVNAGRCQNFEVGFSACTQFYAPGSLVTLQGRSVVANSFAGFSGTGDAVGCSTTPCSFTLNASASVTASFVPLTSIAVTPQNSTIDIGQNQFYTATGTFSDTSTRPLAGGPGFWSSRNNLPAARFGNAVVTLNGRIYSIGGVTPAGPLTSVDRYEAATGPFGQNQTWSAVAALPSPRESLAAAVIDAKIYAVGGHTLGGVSVATLEMYNPIGNTWTSKAPMPTPRAGLAAAALNGKLYVSGGGESGARTTIFEAYDPFNDMWETLPSMPTARRNHATVAVEGVVLVIGGDAAGTSVEAYDPATGSWSARTSLPLPRQAVGAAVVSGLTYVVGGFGGMQPTMVYNTVTDAWTTNAGLPTARGQMGVTAFDNRVWAVGGLASPLNTVSNAVHAFRPAEVHFTTTNFGIASINSNGQANGFSAGTVTVRARAGSVTCGIGGGFCATLIVAEPEPEECAIVRLALAPGSAMFSEVLLEVRDAVTGAVLEPAFAAPIPVQFGVTPRAYDLRFQAPAGYTVTPAQVVRTINCGDEVDIALNFAPIDTTAPTVTASAPAELWNGGTVPVTVTGTMSDAGAGVNASTATFTVIDEYGSVQPSGTVTVAASGNYSFTVALEATRRGTDKDGRRYEVVVSVADNNGNVGTTTSVVVVPHDQGKKKQ